MKENTWEKRLLKLFQMQQIDYELQEIHEMKGDLPAIVDELANRVTSTKAKIKELNELMKQLKKDRNALDIEIIAMTEKLEKYKSQQLQVKSNKQYDALAREIDTVTAKISNLEKEMELLEGKMQVTKTDVENETAAIEKITAEYEERQKELREINKEHEKKEKKLQQQREKLLEKIEKADFERYERIRKAKMGKAVVQVKRGACGGCYNRIPPQKILELRQNSKLFICEHCGRIIVSDDIVAQSAVEE